MSKVTIKMKIENNLTNFQVTCFMGIAISFLILILGILDKFIDLKLCAFLNV